MNHLIKKHFLSFKEPFLISSFLTILASTLNGLGIGLVVPLIGLIVTGDNQEMKIPFLDFFVELLEPLPISPLVSLSGLILFLICLKNLIGYFTLKYSSGFQLKLMASLRTMTVEYLFRLPLTVFQKKHSGDLILLLTKHSGQTALILEDLRTFLGHVFTISIFFYFLICISWQMTLFAIVCLLLFYFPLRWIYKNMKKFGDVSLDDAKKVSGFGIEMVSGFRLIKESSSESQEIDRYNSILKKFNQTQLRMSLAREANRISTEILGILCFVVLVVAWFFLNQTAVAQMDGQEFLSFIILFSRMIPAVFGMITQSGIFAMRLAGAKDLSNYLDEAQQAAQPQGQKVISRLNHELSFKNVAFRYASAEPEVLQGISFSLKRGTSLALVGESGAGKSTILTLIYGFNETTAGQICVDGVSIDELDIHSWRRCIACVSQDTFLFNKSIRENILYGTDNVSESQFQQAIEAAGAKEFIGDLKEKEETLIGERGIRLSGGQAQRIAIARAIVRQPELLILDEATSALDSLTERQVQESLEKLSSSFTTLTIAHRLSTIVHCDKIIVLDKGKIIEEGTHQELLEANKKYATLWKSQTQERK